MSEIFVPGPVSGKNYSFRIAGDQPTADERQRIDAILRQQETEFAGQYQARFGQDLLPSRGVGAQIGEFFRGIPAGAGGLFETAALGLSTPFGEETEDRLREGIRGLGQGLQERYAPPIGREDMGGTRFGQAVGSMGAIAGAGLAGSLLGGPVTGLGVAGALGAGAGAGEASERARAAGATLEERNLATRLGVLPGVAEIVPLVRLNRVLERGGFRERLTRALISGGEEGLQEAASSIAQNLIEQGVYNPEQGAFTGTGEDLGYGAGAGALVQAIADLFIPGRLRGRSGDGTPPADTPPAADTPVTAPAEPGPTLRPDQDQGELFSGLVDATAPERPSPAQGVLDLPEPTYQGRQGELDLSVAMPGTQADLFRDGLSVGEPTVVPGPRAATPAPAATPTDYNAILDQLGVPKPAAVRKAVKSNSIKDIEDFRAKLAKYAKSTSDADRAAAVNAYLNGETAPDARATQETADAESDATGPVEPDATSDRVGLDGGITELAGGPIAGATSPASAQPPVGAGVGQPAVGARAADAPEGTQPSALDAPDADASAAARDTIAEEDVVARQMALDEVASEKAGAAPARAPMSDAEYEQKVRDASALGVRTPADVLVEEGEIAQRRATLAAGTPTSPEAATVAYDPMSGAIPGVETGAAGQVIPPPVPPAPVPPVSSQPQGEAAIPGAARAAAAQREATQKVAAQEAVTAWFEENASADLKLANKSLPGDREIGSLPAKDMRKVLALVQKTKDSAVESPTPAQAARRYFGRTDDLAYALHMIAYDAAQARLPKKNRVANSHNTSSFFGKGRGPVTDADRANFALFKGQGTTAGVQAAQWVEENLSVETRAALIDMRDGRARRDRAAYAGAPTSGEDRDAVRGKTSAGRVGPAQAVSEPTAAQTRANKEKVALDRKALEEEVRADLAATRNGFSPAEWAAMSDEVRQGHVADHFALVGLKREDPGALVAPDAPIAAEPQAEPVRRAVPRRELTPAQKFEQLLETIQAAREQSGMPRTVDDVSMYAGQTDWMSDAHPRVSALIRSGDFKGAMQVLTATAPSAELRQLAQKLLDRIGDTQVQVVSPDVMNAIRAELSPETSTLGVETPAGVYVHPRNEAQIAAMRREGHDAAADLIEQYGGQILFNETSALAPELVLHEAVHRVADGVLTNASHPLTRQLDKLRTNLLKFMPATEYGLSNVRELLTEGMTNPVFRQTLSQVNTEGKPYSAWQEFKHIMRNFLRSIMGQPSVKPDSALTTLDRVLDSVLASNPNEINSGSIVGASFAPGGARQVARDAIARTRVPTKEDLKRTRAMLQSARIPASFKGTLMRYAMPLDYVADAAGKYLPTARRVHDLIMQHQADIQKGSTTVMQTTEATAKVLAKYRRDQPVIDTFNQVLFESSRMQIDPRKPRSAYEGYSYQYNVLDKDGNIMRRVESPRFKTVLERNQALQAYNAKLTPEQRQNPVARAKRAFDEDAAQMQGFDRLKEMRDRLPADVQTELSRMFELQPAMGKELVDAIRTRLEALLPQQKALQDKVFGMIYDKMLAGQLLDPYVGLRRSGQFWLSYSAVDPMTVTRDPVTGQLDYSNAQIEQFKHTFETEGQRTAAMQLLQDMPVDQQVTNIHPYQNVGSQNARPTVPLEFVAGVLDAIDGSEALSRAVDPETGDTANIRTQVIELMFNTLPETSFMNAFKKREGVRGFLGDTTPITQGLTAGDTVKNLRESAMRISRQATDLKYGAEFAAARKALTGEANAFQNTNPNNLDVTELDRQRTEAAQYYDLLTEYTSVPFRQRSKLSRSLTGGAYMLTLGFNVSTALITLSQVPLFVAPFLSGKHGMGRTLAALGEANRLLTGSGRERTVERVGPDGQIEQVRVPVRIYDFSLDNYDFAQSENAYLAALHDIAKRNGVFNRSLMQDELLGEQATTTQKFAAATGIMQHHAERYSRETALMASYHLELQDLMGRQGMPLSQFVQQLKDGTITPTAEQSQAAAMEAVNTSEKTNGPIYAAAGPMASQNDAGAVLYLFKRHPLSMLNLIGQTAMRANPLGANDPADRKIAQRQFAGMLGMIGVMSGTMGLPMMQQVAMLYDLMFADDDEPDFETVVRTTLGEAGAFGLVDYLSGTKVSERIGLGSAIYRPGFAADNLPLPYQFIEGVGGPVVGLGIKYLDRFPKLLAQGEYQRALETFLPSAAANVARAVRFGDEGVRTMRGDIIVDDVGMFSLGAQALGFMPAQYAQQLAMNSVGSRINNAIDTKRTRLLRQRYTAIRNGDRDRVRQIDADIRAFNERHPTNAITNKTLRDSLRSHEQTTARTHHGLSVSPQNEAYIRSITDAFGPATIRG